MLHPDVIMSVKDTTVEKRQANREYKKRTQKYVINSVTFIQALSTHKCYWSHQGLRVFAFLKVKPTKHRIHITHWDLLQLFPACTSSQKSCSPGRAEGETYMWSPYIPTNIQCSFPWSSRMCRHTLSDQVPLWSRGYFRICCQNIHCITSRDISIPWTVHTWHTGVAGNQQMLSTHTEFLP